MTHQIYYKSKSIPELIKEAHENAVAHGWWSNDNRFGDQLSNFHAELSEAWEDYRNNRDLDEIYYECKDPDGYDNCPNPKCESCKYAKPCGIPIELADVIIRILDTCGNYDIDLEKAIEIKMAYNKTRPYKHGGKKI